MQADLCLGTADLTRAIRFHDPVMAVLGLSRLPDPPEGWAGWGDAAATGFALWLCPSWNGQAASTGNGTMLTLYADSAAQVRRFHATALAHGGRCDGPPGTRAAYAPDFYVAYVRDPDGHKIACAFARYRPEEDSQ